jgi:hypothetical protein
MSGTWIVEDEAASRGGSFLNREAALKFIRREFGCDVRIVMEKPSMRHAA